MRNMLCLLLLSRGVPMLLAGDEFAQTQRGNNNAYNQNNETAWLDWQRAEAFGDLTEFVRALIGLRALGRDRPLVLHGVAGEADLSVTSHSLAWAWGDLYVMVNAWWEPLTFVVQAAGAFDVALSTNVEEVGVVDGCVTVPARSTVVLRRVEKMLGEPDC
jgi:glycogen operon protein